MPTKAEMYSQMADKVATQLVGSWKEWTAFLTTAARLYKYPFHEQMMIYAQRPDATACAEYGTIPATSLACAMCSIFPIPAPVNIPVPPGCGSWKNSISVLCRPCWSAVMALPVTISPSSSLM